MALLALSAYPGFALGETETDDPGLTSSLAKRHRLELRAGFWNSDHPEIETSTGTALQRTNIENLMGAFTYAHWVRDDLATHLTFSGLVASVSSIEWAAGTSDSTVVLSSVLFGVRYYPASASQIALHPYLSIGVGPYIGVESISRTGIGINEKTRVLGTFGGQLGGGLDLQLGRHFMVGINLGYNFMADFPEPLAGQWNYSGFEVSAGLSLLIGG
jgi:hypothetical protein